MLQQLITLDAAPAAAGGGMSGILMIVILIAIFYFMMIRPQQKKAEADQGVPRRAPEGRQHYHRRWYIWQNQGDKGKRFHHFDC